MAYPMVPMPTGHDFGQWARSKGIPLVLKSSAHQPTVLFFERILPNGSVRRAILPPDGFDPFRVLSVEDVRFLCDRLRIPRAVFALTLD